MKNKTTTFLLSFFIICIAIVGPVYASEKDFSDVPENHSYYKEIMYLVQKDIIIKSQYFYPNKSATREDVAVMIAKALKLDGTQRETQFSDVPKEYPSSGYIQSAAEAGIINGFADGTFKGNNNVTRGHMAAFIARGFGLTKEANVSFKDVPKNSTAYKPSRQLSYYQITTGYEDGTFKPNQPVSRQHVAVFLTRTLKTLEKNPSTNIEELNNNQGNLEENPFVPERWKTSSTGLYQESMSQYPLPDGIKPFKQKTKEFGKSAPDNFKILGDELGFTDINTSGAAFVPYGANATFYMSYEKTDYYYLVIEAWKSSNPETNIVNLTPYAVKSAFQLFFGEQEGTKFFNTFEKGMNGDKAILKYVDKINTINDRQLKITDLKSSIVIRIGEKGKNYKNIVGW